MGRYRNLVRRGGGNLVWDGWEGYLGVLINSLRCGRGIERGEVKNRNAVPGEKGRRGRRWKVEMSKLGGILLRMPRPITPLETSWNVPGVTILPPPRFYIYIHTFFPFTQHLRVDPVKKG